MTIDVVARGQFYGAMVAEQRASGFIASLTDYERGASIPWHRHRDAYMTFVVGGAYRERLLKRTRSCNARQLVFHDPDETHADDFIVRSRCLNIQYDGLRGIEMPDRLGLVAASKVASMAAEVARELGHSDSLTPIIIEGLLLQLLGELARLRADDPGPTWLHRVREEIVDRFREPLTTTALAASAKVHPVHLARSFKRHFGRSVGEVIRQLRVDYARNAILAGRSLSNVAVDAGFADQSHLTRTFRVVSGMTPAEFRRAHRVPED
jgi:AraC family transcriptional regulator